MLLLVSIVTVSFVVVIHTITTLPAKFGRLALLLVQLLIGTLIVLILPTGLRLAALVCLHHCPVVLTACSPVILIVFCQILAALIVLPVIGELLLLVSTALKIFMMIVFLFRITTVQFVTSSSKNFPFHITMTLAEA